MLVEQKSKGVHATEAMTYKSKRKFHVVLGGMSFLSSFAVIIYLLAAGALVLTSTPVSPSEFFLPVIYLDACIVVFSALNFQRLFRYPFKGSWRSQSVLKVDFIISALLASIAFILIVNFLVGGGTFASYAEFLAYFMSFTIGLLITGWIGIAFSCELHDKESVKETGEIYAEEVMGFRMVMKRTFVYFGKHYAQLLVLFIGIVVLVRVLYIIIISPWHASLLREESDLVAWLLEHNYVAGVSVPQSIYDRARNLYYLQNFFLYIQDVFKSTFNFVMLGIGVSVVIKSYRGSDPLLSGTFSKAKRHTGSLVVISALFAALYHGGLLFFLFPGIILYAYCIFAFPNLLVVEKYKTLQNFGESKNLVKGNFARVALYVVIFYFMQIGLQWLLGYISDAALTGMGGDVALRTWRNDPYTYFGTLVLFESVTGILTAFITPLEAALVAMLFIDLNARRKAKVREAQKESTAKGRTQSLKELPFEQRLQKARYCPRCGLSVRKGITRCPNCKAEVP